MIRRWVFGIAVGFLLLITPPRVLAQAEVAVPDASIEAALQNLASRAALVFVGQVVAIQRHTGVVEIVFRVDRPVVGQVGAQYTLREWAGLWPPGQWRYIVGERAMVFLHAASTAGFSSAVDGGEGVVPVIGAADGTPLLDIRLLSTRVLRQVGDPLPGPGSGAIALSDALPLITHWRHHPVRPPVRRRLPGVTVPETPSTPVKVALLPPGQASDNRLANSAMRGVDAQ